LKNYLSSALRKALIACRRPRKSVAV